jgi:hypothetical protein
VAGESSLRKSLTAVQRVQDMAPLHVCLSAEGLRVGHVVITEQATRQRRERTPHELPDKGDCAA